MWCEILEEENGDKEYKIIYLSDPPLVGSLAAYLLLLYRYYYLLLIIVWRFTSNDDSEKWSPFITLYDERKKSMTEDDQIRN